LIDMIVGDGAIVAAGLVVTKDVEHTVLLPEILLELSDSLRTILIY